MRSSLHRAGWLIAAALTLLLFTFASAAAASTSPYPPACAAGAPPQLYPPLACVRASSQADSYSTPLVRQALSVTHHIVGHGPFAYVAVDVKVGFSDALLECPGGGVPLSAIPCQQDSVSIGIAGRYYPKHRYLDVSDIPVNLTPGCTQQVPDGVCTYHFKLSEAVVPGLNVYVISVSAQELTQNPANDLGGAGFEFSVGVNVPKPSKGR